MQLSEKLYWYPWQGRANNCNSILYNGDLKILFDPGHFVNDFNENCFEQLAGRLKADGFDLADLDLVLCTHAHPDHIESVGVIREQSGAKVGLHREDQPFVEAISGHYESQSGGKFPSIAPDFFLEEGPFDPGKAAGVEALKDSIEIMHTPGHSPGCVCFYLPGEKALISGDTIFEGSIGRADLPGGNMGILGESVDKIATLEDVELLLPGHMGYVSGSAAVKRNIEQIKMFFFR